MDWLKGEPTLEEALSDPVVKAVLRRDSVDRDELRLFLNDVKRKLADKLGSCCFEHR
jgi:hypothetical protein